MEDTITVDSKMGEYFVLTNKLRFKCGKLQQMWQGSAGTENWVEVEHVN